MISFVGAGPGAPDLLTLRAAARLAQAEIVIWPSSLVPEPVIEQARRNGARILDSASMTLEDVLQIYEANASARIVRLHSGDPSIYGALAEQVQWCLRHGRSFEIVPGVSSLSAAAACLQTELTIPGISQSVVLTRLASRTKESMPGNSDALSGPESIASWAAHGATMAIFLSASQPRRLQQALLDAQSAYGPNTPAAVVVRATWPDQQLVRTTVGELANAISSTSAARTVLVLVGEALSVTGQTGELQRSHLYDPGFAHGFRKRSLPGSTRGRPVRRRPS
jgi:precorrin-4/cobalt-precorrin-4 C11-methyltransferase